MRSPTSSDEPLEGQWPLFQDPPFQPADFEVRRGDVFALGDACRLMCGDATRREDVATLFAGQKPTLVVTSPPYADCRDYNDPIPCWDTLMMGAFDGHDFADDVQMLVNLGVIHRKNEWMPYWWHWLQNMRERNWRHYSLYVWDKQMALPGAFQGRLKPSYEFVFHINKVVVAANAWQPCKRPGDTRSHRSDVRSKDGKSKRRDKKPHKTHKVPDNVIRLRPISSYESTGHPAQYPKGLASYIIKSWANSSSLVYDPFLGSGSTALAATDEGVASLGMELSPAYCQIALKRWAKAHPDKPVRRL